MGRKRERILLPGQHRTYTNGHGRDEQVAKALKISRQTLQRYRRYMEGQPKGPNSRCPDPKIKRRIKQLDAEYKRRARE
jgi:hypothetical protein